MPCPVSIGVMALLSAISRGRGVADLAMGIGAIGTLGLLIPAILLLADGPRLRRRASRNLNEGVLERFVVDERILAEMRASAAVGLPMPAFPPSIDVLVFDPRLVRVGDQIQRRWRRVSIAGLAEPSPPPPAGSPAQPPPEPIRDLTEDERRELRALIRRMNPLRVIPVALLLGGLTALGIAAIIRGRMNAVSYVAWLIFLGMLLYLLPGLIRLPARYIRLRRDLSEGKVQRITNDELRARAVAPKHGEIPPDHLEELPASKFLWTIDGIPAPWRQRVQRRQ